MPSQIWAIAEIATREDASNVVSIDSQVIGLTGLGSHDSRELPASGYGLQEGIRIVLEEWNIVNKVDEENVRAVEWGGACIVLPTRIRIGHPRQIPAVIATVLSGGGINGTRPRVSRLHGEVTIDSPAQLRLQRMIMGVCPIERLLDMGVALVRDQPVEWSHAVRSLACGGEAGELARIRQVDFPPVALVPVYCADIRHAEHSPGSHGLLKTQAELRVPRHRIGPIDSRHQD